VTLLVPIVVGVSMYVSYRNLHCNCRWVTGTPKTFQ